MHISLAQINSTIGDFDGNMARILSSVEKACLASPGRLPDLVVFPELCLCGYPPLDLLEQESFVAGCLSALRLLQRSLPVGIAVAVGHVDRNRSGSGRSLVNAMTVIADGRVVFSQAKTLLPTYDVFDEARYFEPARERKVFQLAGESIGFAICEDIWWEAPPSRDFKYVIDPVKELLDAGAGILIVPSASPFVSGKMETRISLAAKAAREGGIPVLYCNLTGADDSLVFDGRSFALDASGVLRAMAGWGEEILEVDTSSLASAGLAGNRESAPALRYGTGMEEVGIALVTGIRDYMRKCGFSKACLGLSGGIDSALVAVLAAEAIGPENVTCIAMPSRFSSEGSISDSEELCRRSGMKLVTLPIEAPFGAYLELLEPRFEGLPFGLAEENLQARIRGAILMSWSNKFGCMVLTTGNKSEIAVGYCTLYGDMCGALAPIGDLLKTEVYELSRYLNGKWAARHGGSPVIPEPILTKAPSAELRYDQKDQDSLPPYELLDTILELYIEEELSCAEIVARGFERALVERVVTMTARAEYKRRQAAPVLKVSRRAFGLGRRMPIARAVHESRI
jgi:NAD+ synthase (glutamine-hydrolysing)